MHIAVFYQYYHNPDCALTGRHYTFLKHWAQRHEVTLITTRVWHDRRITDDFPWVPPGVRLHMLDVPYDNTMGSLRRMMAFQHFAAGALLKGLTIPRPDVIFGTSTPLTAAWVAARVAHLRRVPWVFEVRDLWPDFPIQMGALPQPWLQRRLHALERRLYQSAAHIIPLSTDMEAHIRAQGIPLECITTLVNGTDFDLLDACSDEETEALRARHSLTGKRVVLYGGSFGRANDLPTLLQAAVRLQYRDDLRFVFIGQGYEEDQVRVAAESHPGIILLPPQPRHRMFHWFKIADLSLVSFIDLPVLATNSPSKFFDSLAAGTPVIVTNPGWTKTFVETHGCGWYVPAGRPEALAQGLETALNDPSGLALAGQQGAAVARRAFDRVVLAERLEAVLQAAARSPRDA